jgi:transcription antitermination factor NusA-like protein
VTIDDPNKTAMVIMPDNQLSLAIGKSGQNVRLAARLTGWRIDIRSESQAVQDGVISETPVGHAAGGASAMAEAFRAAQQPEE